MAYQKFDTAHGEYAHVIKTAAGAVTKGAFAETISGSAMYGYAFERALASGDLYTLVTKCKKVIAVKDNAAINPGERVYWIPAGNPQSADGGAAGSGAVSATIGGTGILVGICVEAAAAGDPVVTIDFDGTLSAATLEPEGA